MTRPSSRFAWSLAMLALIPLPAPFRAPALAAEAGSRGSRPRVSVATAERSVTRIAEGVYVIRHKDGPDTNPQGNTTVIIGGRDVLVVDSGYLPSSAREDIAEIRRWTKKPVRYLVNTHWHPDHIRGNASYAEAFPGLAIVAHEKTPELERGFDEPNLTRYRARITALRREVDSGRRENGTPLTEAERRDAAKELERRSAVEREFKTFTPAYPTVTFSREMAIDLGGRVVRLEHLGPGHTVGDVVATLPREKILVAGDHVAYPVPYFFAGYPYGEIEALERILAMDVQTIVPGHGPVLRDKAYVARTLELLRHVRAQVVAEVRRRGSLSAKLDDVRKAIDFGQAEKQFAGGDEESIEFFRESMDGLVKTLFYQIAE